MKPTLHFIGTGGAFDYEAGNSAALVAVGGRRILLDCGHSVYPRLRQLNLVEQLDAVLVTHLHDDHVGSLSTLLFHRNFFTPDRKLVLLTASDGFREELDHYLRPMMGRPADFFTYADAASVPGIVPVDTTGLHFAGMTSFGFIFADPAHPDADIAFSGDLGESDILFRRLDERGRHPAVVYHDMALMPNIKPHASYEFLRPYAERYPVVGYHHDHRWNPQDNVIPLAAQQPGLVL